MRKSKKGTFARNNTKTSKKSIILIASLMIILSVSSLMIGNYIATKGIFFVKTSENVKSTASQINDASKYSALFTVRDTLIEKYDGEINDDVLLEGAIKGMTSALNDPYTVFMNNDEFEKLIKQSNGSMTGIGVNIANLDNKIVIVSPIKDSPAEKAGIKSNDVIEKINDVAYTGDQLSEAVSVISNSVGSEIKFTIDREGTNPFDVVIKPQEVKLSVIDGEMLDSSMGYIRIHSFMNENTTEDFKNKIEELKGQGMKGLIVDLRENPGGLLSEAVGVASQFIPKDKIITYTVDKYENRNESLSVGGIAEEMPLVILVNEDSASASEVVTGALRDYKAATIVGNTTFGKGIVQQTVRFNNGIGGLKVTISKYYTPNGENIHKIGIVPDVEVSTDNKLDSQGYNKDQDKQLKTAIDELNKKMN
ncbi:MULTISPECIES: S41 family peptidase [Clostridium]|uniref:S41 family peptidase n=1 Tax=Clostridium TaxID=1485 RepID=UPI0005EB8754|nr:MULTISPECIES: S41 family peptidase [Clostridium]MDB2138532.1 S41 family peptidase [Clostridium butyricum]MDI9210890.1 S41 family peptidase [Clostridium butyricum]MDU0324305.1 S41 family peptidase [Clostridium butyricum]MDU1339016.1 S41 family peptidase [Clostridium butyricum]MDU4587925.1 S41 family peptidase [Clostridium sp.]